MEKEQEKTDFKIDGTQKYLTIAGDGRHDSIGHSAKYCAYTLFCCTVPCIFGFSLVQVIMHAKDTILNIYTQFTYQLHLQSL